ncbi:MAG TPA: IclR family transcriptional regulator [Ktedonobacteraceae bacterium]|nr:IclR family transcriptional regulator [Ktedonobacteraceae bacterium]
MKNTEPARKPNYPIESVDNALQLLLLFRKHKAISVSEASRMIEVAPSTAHRLLAMLQYHGFVSQDPTTRLYAAGPALIDIGLSVIRGMDLRGQALPFMQQLCQEVGETVHLAVLQGSMVLFLESIECEKVIRVSSRIGVSLPACCTAAGKAMLAEISLERLHELYAESELPTLTPHSLRTRADLECELQCVRERGYATNFEESEPDLSALAAVILDRHGQARASITVSAPVSRMNDEQVVRIAQAMLCTAARIGESLA